MMPFKLFLIILTCFSFAVLSADDEIVHPESSFALGVNIGTKGLGLDALLNVSDKINLRGSYSQYEFSESFDEDGISYDGDLDIDVFGVLIDYYPMGGSFRLSAGYYNNGSAIAAEAQPESAGTVNINGFDYDLSGESVRTDIDWDSGAPYLGFGWGNAFADGSGFSWAIDLGVLVTDEPMATLSASQGLFTQAALFGRDLSVDIAAEENELNNDLSDFDLYPVAQIMFTYSF